MDLGKTQRGVRPGPIPGTIWLDGHLYTACIPERLRELEPPTLVMNESEKAHLRDVFDAREPYRFVPHGRHNKRRGTQRFRGPAVDGHPFRVRCPNTRLDANAPHHPHHRASKTNRAAAARPSPSRTPTTNAPAAAALARQPWAVLQPAHPLEGVFGSTATVSDISRFIRMTAHRDSRPARLRVHRPQPVRLTPGTPSEALSPGRSTRLDRSTSSRLASHRTRGRRNEATDGPAPDTHPARSRRQPARKRPPDSGTGYGIRDRRPPRPSDPRDPWNDETPGRIKLRSGVSGYPIG